MNWTGSAPPRPIWTSIPALSLYGIVRSQARDFGFETSASDVGVMADFMLPSENYLTGNDITVYAFASIDLKVDGPTVVEIPPGMYGTANDAAFKYLTDFGPTGPDQGKGGSYLFLPPGCIAAMLPEGYVVFRSPGYRIWAMMRGFGEVGTWRSGRGLVQGSLSRCIPLATRPARTSPPPIAPARGPTPCRRKTAPRSTRLNEIIQYEPTELFDPELLGRLATLGIEKGKPFKPDTRMRGIFDHGSEAGRRHVARDSSTPRGSREINYWPNRRWEKMFLRNTEFLYRRAQ